MVAITVPKKKMVPNTREATMARGTQTNEVMSAKKPQTCSQGGVRRHMARLQAPPSFLTLVQTEPA